MFILLIYHNWPNFHYFFDVQLEVVLCVWNLNKHARTRTSLPQIYTDRYPIVRFRQRKRYTTRHARSSGIRKVKASACRKSIASWHLVSCVSSKRFIFIIKVLIAKTFFIIHRFCRSLEFLNNLIHCLIKLPISFFFWNYNNDLVVSSHRIPCTITGCKGWRRK